MKRQSVRATRTAKLPAHTTRSARERSSNPVRRIPTEMMPLPMTTAK